MASLNIRTTLSKFGHVGAAIARRSTWNPNFFFASSPRSLRAMSDPDGAAAREKASEAVQHGADEAINTGEDMKNKAAAAEQDVSGKGKQKVQDEWGSDKENAQKAKDTVIGKADDSKEVIKENADTIKRSMNSKN
ncbi:uncharacterized protein At4g13230-like [Tripterygium wilfordii]|uniref:uncharacterized protein At4g13230-like n=1 Tax=Tripterygium wilfordii TaxID=458696 RepID=UPI0018F84492|nr:uncharacterized protein At4g13230-like [Tripterygium wilfordii]